MVATLEPKAHEIAESNHDDFDKSDLTNIADTVEPATAPSALDLISSNDPALYSRMIDLTPQLGPKIQSFNVANPESEIKLFGKAEFMNPGMSHKDRIAKAMLSKAEARGDLVDSQGNKKTILAASSGNTGCSLALVGTMMGYDVVIITNAKCSMEKRAHIRTNGATLWMAEELPSMFPKDLEGITDYMAQESALVKAYPSKYYSVNQYDNLDNMEAHYETTGKEIWEQTKGQVTHFVMAGSTGGTIMGVGKYLKEKKGSDVTVVLSDPHKSHLLGLFQKNKNPERGEEILEHVNSLIQQEGGGMKVEGAGKAELTAIMTHNGVLHYVDDAIAVHDFDAFEECRSIAKNCGILVGGSAGLNVAAARVLAERCLEEGPRHGGSIITTLLCDHGIKYMSKIYNDEWISANDNRKSSK
jgi:cysteine synthase